MKKAAKAPKKRRTNGDYSIEVLTPVPAGTDVPVKVVKEDDPDYGNICCVGRIYPTSYPELSLTAAYGKVYPSNPTVNPSPLSAGAIQGTIYDSVKFRFRGDGGNLLPCESDDDGRDQWLVVWVHESSDSAGYYKTMVIQFDAVSSTTTACGD